MYVACPLETPPPARVQQSALCLVSSPPSASGGMLAAPLWTAAAFVAQPRHQPVPALRHRVARPVAVSVDDAMPIIAFGVGSLAAAAWALNGRPTGLTSPTPGAPAPTAPLSVPEPELLTPEGQRLCQMLASRPAEFSDSWSALLRSMGDTSNAPGSSLQARVAEVQRREDSRRVLVDALGLAVAHTFAEERLVLLPSAAAISPGASLPPEAATLVRVSQQFPGQSAKQVRAFVTEAAPSNDEATSGRVDRLQVWTLTLTWTLDPNMSLTCALTCHLDRLQAAQLYMGHIQFGYFIAQIFRGQAGLSDETVVSAQEAQQIKGRIEQAAQMMRSEVAWAAASRRAASLFGLPAPESSTSLGVEDLRLFSKGVQVVTPSQQAEFFSSPADESGRDEEVAAATFAAPLPSASFIPFNAAGLQCALAEGCLFGWQLWGAETAASQALGDATARALMLPPERVPPS